MEQGDITRYPSLIKLFNHPFQGTKMKRLIPALLVASLSLWADNASANAIQMIFDNQIQTNWSEIKCIPLHDTAGITRINDTSLQIIDGHPSHVNFNGAINNLQVSAEGYGMTCGDVYTVVNGNFENANQAIPGILGVYGAESHYSRVINHSDVQHQQTTVLVFLPEDVKVYRTTPDLNVQIDIHFDVTLNNVPIFQSDTFIDSWINPTIIGSDGKVTWHKSTVGGFSDGYVLDQNPILIDAYSFTLGPNESADFNFGLNTSFTVNYISGSGSLVSLIPEPSSLSLIFLGGFTFLLRRKPVA